MDRLTELIMHVLKINYKCNNCISIHLSINQSMYLSIQVSYIDIYIFMHLLYSGLRGKQVPVVEESNYTIP